ncbi:hypothetical protein KKE60_07770 [Patescibacteria group bacterium]|nr:hypothetical protein [Patescibacteria group bacterium]
MTEKPKEKKLLEQIPDADHVQDDKLDSLLKLACKAYGIPAKYVFNSRFDPETNEMVIVTNGGKKVRYAKDDDVQTLNQIEVTGINPDWDKKKFVAGKKEK